MPYARLIEVIRIASEAQVREEKEEWKRAAWISYRANPPRIGDSKQVFAFGEWLAQLGLAEPVKPYVPELSDEEIEQLFKQGKMGLFPPGMRG